ncbi:hypothetical protein D3C71_2029610 [compost metagenome]
MQPQAVFDMAQRNDFARAEDFGRIGLGAQRAQVVGRDVVDVQRQDAEREFGIALLVVDAAQLAQQRIIDLWIALRQV